MCSYDSYQGMCLKTQMVAGDFVLVLCPLQGVSWRYWTELAVKIATLVNSLSDSQTAVKEIMGRDQDLNNSGEGIQLLYQI